MEGFRLMWFMMVIFFILQDFDGVLGHRSSKERRRGRGHGRNTESTESRESSESSESSEENGCSGLRRYCENENTCAYTFLIQDDDNECPDVREMVADVQSIAENVESNTDLIDELKSENEAQQVVLDYLESEVDTQMRLIRELRATQDEMRETYDAQLVALLHKHRFQARQIQQLIDGLEEVDREEPPTSPSNQYTTIAEPTSDRLQELLQMVPSTETVVLNLNQQTSYVNYIQEIDQLLEVYNDADYRLYEDCPSGPTSRDNFNRRCYFSLALISEFCSSPNYGFDTGKPCLFFFIKTPRWRPRSYRNSSIPEEIVEFYNPDAIPVTCTGKTRDDQADVGTLEYNIQNNLNFKFFPYLGESEGDQPYLVPLMAVRFLNVAPNTLVDVQCKAWAQNIHHSMGQGILNFSIQINGQAEKVP
ncbi:uncharacterized protein LOC144442187 [Glandiceps talaboti]